MSDQKTYSIPFDDTIDRLIWSMRDGLGEAIAAAREHLLKFPDDSVLSVRVRKVGTSEETVYQNHLNEQLKSALDSLNEALEERMSAAMDNTFIPYPKKSGERESFGKTGSEMRAFRKVHEIVYPHLVLLAQLIGKARELDEDFSAEQEADAPCRQTSVTLEAILAELLRNTRKESTQ